MDLTNLNIDRKIRRKNSGADYNPLMLGKIPPQAKELEEAVLGAIMLEKSAFDTVAEILQPQCFYVDAHQRIFRAFTNLAKAGEPIDILTVVEQLRKSEELELVGGAYYISTLTNRVVSSANLDAHARIVLQKFIQRELIRSSSETITESFEDSADAFDLLDNAEARLFEITNNHLKKSYTEIQTVLVQTMKRIDALRQSNEEISGVPSGFHSLDAVTYGWQPTDLIILAARPSVGKTAFALNLVRNAALHPTRPTPVAFFSLEMSAGQLVQRILSAESEIHLEKISRGRLEEHEMQQLIIKGVNRLDKAPIFIDDTAALNIFELRAKCRRLKNKHNIGLIVIDYLQLMSGTGDSKGTNREQEISTISRNLKTLAKELEVPIIALSQLSREVEKRKDGNKMPQLSDLRESGAIEQDADMVMFLYRPDYYNEVNPQDAHGESTKNETHVRIAKHRNGGLETIKLRSLLYIQKFEEMSDQPSGYGFSSATLPAGLPSQGNWTKLDEDGNVPNSGSLFIQRPSKMNDDEDANADYNDSDDVPF